MGDLRSSSGDQHFWFLHKSVTVYRRPLVLTGTNSWWPYFFWLYNLKSKISKKTRRIHMNDNEGTINSFSHLYSSSGGTIHQGLVGWEFRKKFRKSYSPQPSNSLFFFFFLKDWYKEKEGTGEFNDF